ncbi:MAG: 3-methyl-2-oxobutanoate hydroxymethyltransferase [Nitrospinae bacterium]|nr:3-methyl-2-oxobutanoate hydroxymethyltransferase [Nitrospinota bacterium]MBL7020479.1 3-methyl-2-oxobutanoate hydroxymethyltransferase [Nitrospinaceae bacterium]
MDTRPVTVPEISGRKNSEKKITALTAYDYSFAKLLDATDLDIILVGDSLGMVSLGHENTLAVTMENMIDHTRAVKQGAQRALVVGDMPFMSYQVSVEQAVTNAGRLIQEGGASAVKLEGGARMADRVQAIVQAGIPVMGHIGLTPQSVHQFGGYKVQGKNYLDSRQIKQDARDLQSAGIFALVLEGIPGELAEEITAELKLPTIGIGAGAKCDGQILVLHDLLGLNQDFVPKFVKQYAQLADSLKNAVAKYIQEVRTETFPGQEHTYHSKQAKLKQVNDGNRN